MRILLPYLIYPIILSVSILSYWIGIKIFPHPLVGAYAAVSSASVWIFVLESYFPLHKEWIPTKKELIEEVLFYSLFIQVIFPFSLYFILKNYFPTFDIWPHSWNKFYQFLLILFVGEFFQYWWHRLAHTYKILWPIHAIHHYPRKLYAWNTSHFHFLDKLVELTFTVFLFFAIGMSLEIFTYYYVFYAVTGFIQHSNLDIRLGVLDYVIASGETHRFHHDSDVKKSFCNFANNVVIFDLFFNTFKRNPNEQLVEVGIRKGRAPDSVVSENTYPFIQIKKKLVDLVFKQAMRLIDFKKVRPFKAACENPRGSQENLLSWIITKNKDSQFGHDHKFHEIKSIADFKRHVPIQDYEDIRYYVNLIINGNEKALTSESPFYFAKTSGTTGLPKYIPITNESQQSILDAQQVLSNYIFKLSPDYLSGDIFSIVGLEVEEVIGKIPSGSMSGKLYSLANPLVRAKHVFHPDLIQMNPNERYLHLALLALLSVETSFYVSPNPSTLLKIFEIINYKKEELIKLLTGRDHHIFKKYEKNIEHALNLLKSNNPIKISDVWPNLRVISLWTGGSCSYLIPKIKNQISSDTKIVELGYISSEFYGSVPVEPDTYVLTLMDCFFEFIEKNAYEQGERETLLLDQLNEGMSYYIIVTTKGGFYRYFINDIIRVVGKYKKTPQIVFEQKGKGVTNLTGEKLTEKQLVSFFEGLNKNKDDVSFFICLADQEKQKYTMYIEAHNNLDVGELAQQLDLYLKEVNIEYKAKVNDKRLSPIEIILLKSGTAKMYQDHCLKLGQRESQFKFLHLQYAQHVSFLFQDFVKEKVKS